MRENLTIINNWYTSLQPVKELKLSEAKYLFKKYIAEENEGKRKYLRDILLIGTLHFVYRQLLTFFSFYIPSGEIAMEDIIQTSCELWIKNVLNKKVLTVSQCEFFLESSFFKQLEEMLLPKISYQDIFKMSKDTFFDLLKKYIIFRYKKNSSYEKSIDGHLHILFDDIYCYLEDSGFFFENDCNLEEQLSVILPYVFYQVFFVSYNFKNPGETVCQIETNLDFIENQVLSEQFKTIYKELPFPSQRNKMVVWDYRIREMKREEIEQQYSISSSRISQIDNNICRQIRQFDQSTHEIEGIYQELCR